MGEEPNGPNLWEPGSKPTHSLHVEGEGENTKLVKKPITFKRQLALIEVVAKTQRECEHTLIIIGSNLIVCSECSALWVK